MNHFGATDAPAVSIVMPAYNAASTIGDSIGSVLSQTHSIWELLIVDDGSTDATFALARSYAERDARVRVLRTDANSGVAHARNLALQHAKHAYVAFLDSDDLWVPEKLSKQLSFMVRNSARFCFTYYHRIDSSGRPVGDVVKGPQSLSYRQLLRNSAIPCLTVMIDRRHYPELCFPGIRHEDYALWLSLLRGGERAVCLPEDLACYRVSSSSLSANKLRSVGWVWRVYRDSEGLGVLGAAACLAGYALNAVLRRASLLRFRGRG
jgi:teichuronic acid biosynthesis glycosyltransferase TuaG